MAIGQVSIIKVDNASGGFNEVNRLFLFVGKIGDETRNYQIQAISPTSDLDTLLGEGDSEVKTQVRAAILNSRSENFACYALGVADSDDVVEFAEATLEKPNDLGIEAIVFCNPVKATSELTKMNELVENAKTKYGKYIFAMACTAGCLKTQTWSEYQTSLLTIVASEFTSDFITVVPLLFGNDLGVYAGRLADSSVQISDSPMRVATGALVSLTNYPDVPVDKDDIPLDMAFLKTLSQKRFSVPQWYNGYAGMYWADGMTLATEASDYQVIENLRVVLHVMRQIRILAIKKIADRALNNTPASISAHITYFGRVLREASKSLVLFGKELPGMVQYPRDKDITIQWQSLTKVAIGVTIRPYNCPKDITVYVGLDLSGE